MRQSFYPKMAWSGISHNKKLYLPYIITCIAMVMMFYMIDALSISPVLSTMHGGQVMQGMLTLGKRIIAIFALIFLFYTSSFLSKRRSREYGLYNVLGMDKRNLSHIHFLETAMIAGISLIMGLFCGILFSKLAELWVVRILKGTSDFTLRIEGKALIETVIVFAVIFLVILCHSLRKMHMASPMELLRSEHTGEKPPKGNWIMAVLGLILLVAAYYFAVTIEDPVAALTLFFAAVLMVIAATYLLFIAGSVTLCKILQKNKRYYYKKQHFVSIASMSYRMKRNGAGLASICVLSTMVLVMLSSTICLYTGTENIMHERYPRDLQYTVHTVSPDALNDETESTWRQWMTEAAQESHLTASDPMEYTVASFYGQLQGQNIKMMDELSEEGSEATTSSSKSKAVYVAPVSVYNTATGENETLTDGEVIAAVYGGSYDGDTLTIHDQIRFNVKKHVDNFKAINMDGAVSNEVIYLFVPNFSEVAEKLAQYNTSDMVMTDFKWYYGCNLSGDDDAQIAAADCLNEKFASLSEAEQANIKYVVSDSYARNKDDFYGSYGGLFVLGVLLGIVFIFAAVLIIYYKQVTEGYEDQAGFTIMQKVGMTKKDIRQSINSQILIVFFAPLLLAGLHLAFAFPLLYQLLQLFGLKQIQFLALVTVGCYLLFAIFYIIIYKMTSGVYYRIVSTSK